MKAGRGPSAAESGSNEEDVSEDKMQREMAQAADQLQDELGLETGGVGIAAAMAPGDEPACFTKAKTAKELHKSQKALDRLQEGGRIEALGGLAESDSGENEGKAGLKHAIGKLHARQITSTSTSTIVLVLVLVLVLALVSITAGSYYYGYQY